MRRCLIAGIAVLGALVAAPGASADGSTLSTRLQELATKDLRDASHADQADAISLLPGGPGSISRAGGGVLVEIRVDGNDHARSEALAAVGAEIAHVSHEYDTITAAVDESELRAVAAVPGVEYVGEVITPMTGAVDDGGGASGAINTCATGVVSEGNAQLKADVAKTQFDVDGGGVKVGILSDSYDTNAGASTDAAGDVASGDLPGPGNPCGRTAPVQVLDDSAVCTPATPPGCGDEGRAMLQIVHDIAPGASLAFATASVSQTTFADNIRALADAGAKIIADDLIYLTEPMYQDGIIAKAVNDVSAQGAAYFTMAFNSNGLGINSYEAPNGYRSTTCPAAVLADRPLGADSCMDFGGGDNAFDMTLLGGSTPFRLSLSWAEPQNGITDDFDVYVFNPNTGGTISLAAKNDNVASGLASEFGSFNSGGGNRQLVIRRYAGTGTPRIKFVVNDNGSQVLQATQAVTPPDVQGPTIYGHNGAAAAQTVAAVPFNDAATVEPYSGRGPVTSLFAPISGTAQPADALPSPVVLDKPDVAATDCGQNTFFGAGAPPRFCGTSAAAPHAAGVAALQLAAEPGMPPTQLKADQQVTAITVGGFGHSAAGAGLIQATGALAAATTPFPTVSVASPPPTNDSTPAVDFTLTGASPSATCSLDGGTPEPCTSPFTPPSPIGDGAHTLDVRALDVYRHAASGSGSFSVDTAGPNVQIDGRPPDITNDNTPTWSFSGPESDTRYLCSIDGAVPAPCSAPGSHTAAALGDGPHTFSVAGQDPLDNTGPAASQQFTVDATAPDTKIAGKRRVKTTKTKVKIKFSSSDPQATFQCGVDKKPFASCRSPFKTPKLKPGKHRVQIRATDQVGNSDQTPARVNVTVKRR